ncbi:hypothetical protein [Agrobacterium salinitolerans]|nr:hypothetical protein KHC17_28360 [Agrobacterium salinitolerans]
MKTSHADAVEIADASPKLFSAATSAATYAWDEFTAAFVRDPSPMPPIVD